MAGVEILNISKVVTATTFNWAVFGWILGISSSIIIVICVVLCLAQFDLVSVISSGIVAFAIALGVSVIGVLAKPLP